MHIIQIQTIGAWKGAQERSGKTIFMVFSNFSSLLQGMGRDFKECVTIVNPKHVIYWVINYRTMKYVLEKHDGWHGAMVWPHRALVNSWEGLIYFGMHALHKSNHHRGSSMLSRGKSPRLKGNPNFCASLWFSFFQQSTYRLKSNVFKFDIFPNSFTIFRGLCAFSRH